MRAILMRIASKEFNEQLINEGVIYMNTINYFRKMEGDMSRGDDFECVSQVQQITWIKLLPINGGAPVEISVKEDAKLKMEKPAIMKSWDAALNGNIYCMYALTSAECDGPIMVDPKIYDFGESFVIFLDTNAIINRITAALQNLGLHPQRDFVRYYSESEQHEILTPFDKRARFSHQKEYRFFVERDVDEPLRLELGPLHDIAVMDDIEALDRTCFFFDAQTNIFEAQTFDRSIRDNYKSFSRTTRQS